MDLTLGAEQEAVRDSIRGVLADRQPSARVRAVMASERPSSWKSSIASGRS